MMTKKDFEVIADRIREMSIPAQVEAFNALVPGLKELNPRFSVVDFYDRVFYGEMQVGYEEYSKKAYVK